MLGILERIERGVERVETGHLVVPRDDALGVFRPQLLGVGREPFVQPDVLPAEQASNTSFSGSAWFEYVLLACSAGRTSG